MIRRMSFRPFPPLSSSPSKGTACLQSSPRGVSVIESGERAGCLSLFAGAPPLTSSFSPGSGKGPPEELAISGLSSRSPAADDYTSGSGLMKTGTQLRRNEAQNDETLNHIFRLNHL